MRGPAIALFVAFVFILLMSSAFAATDFFILIDNLEGHRAFSKNGKYRISNMSLYPLQKGSAVELISKDQHGRDDYVLIKTESGKHYFMSPAIFRQSTRPRAISVESLNPNIVLSDSVGKPPHEDCLKNSRDKNVIELVSEESAGIELINGEEPFSFPKGLEPILIDSTLPAEEKKDLVRQKVFQITGIQLTDPSLSQGKEIDNGISLIKEDSGTGEITLVNHVTPLKAPQKLQEPKITIPQIKVSKIEKPPRVIPPAKPIVFDQGSDEKPEVDIVDEQSASDELEQELLKDRRIGANNYERLKTVARNAFFSDGWKDTACLDSRTKKAKYTAKELEDCKRRYYCHRKLTQAYDKGDSIWEDFSLEQRATRIKQHADRTYKKIIESGKSISSSTSLGFSRWKNPDLIHEELNPSIATCIAFIETRGTLNPHAINYSFCQRKNISTAHGLGQMTRTTFKNMSKKLIHPKQGRKAAVYENLLPITTIDDYEGKSTNDIFYAINDDVPLQMEVIFRLINHELKFGETTHKMTDEQVILKAVAAYDQDQKSAYLRRFNNCYSCMEDIEEAKDAYQCYKKMGK